MYRTLLLSVAVASISMIVGCGAGATRHSATPSTTVACDESAWTPPDEMAISIATPKNVVAATPAQVQAGDSKLKGSYRPNRNDRPSRGAVHAATY